MTDINKTAVLLIIDRSGSMAGVPGSNLQAETENSINTFLEEQRQVPGELLVEIVDFDDRIETQLPLTHIDNVKNYKLVPRNMTALHDAMGQSIVKLGQKLARLPEAQRPGRVVVVTVTDGFENASREYDAGKVKELVEQQKNKYNWDFVFLAANQDAVLTGQGLGISQGSSLTYDPSLIAAASSGLSNYVTTYRGSGNATFTDSDREASVDSNS